MEASDVLALLTALDDEPCATRPGAAGRYDVALRAFQGSLSGRELRCASAEEQVLMHQGYEPRPEDLTDVRRLCDRFGLAWPFSGP